MNARPIDPPGSTPDAPRRHDTGSPAGMQDSRRAFLRAGALAGGAALAGGVALGGPSRSAFADDAPALPTVAGQAPPTYTRTLGEATITTLLDGWFELGHDTFTGVEPGALEALLAARHLAPTGPVPIGVCAHLVQLGDRLLLVDAGAAELFGPTAGRLHASLANLGVEPGAVTDLLLTHLHPDHVAGALLDGRPAFPNATLHVAEADAAFWSDASIAAGAPDGVKPFFALARDVLEGYGERVSRFAGDADLGDGVTSVAMPGHTPGHTGFRIESGAERLLIWGDLAAVAAVQIPRPDIGLTFDVDGAQAAKSRRRTLDMASADGVLVAGSHLPFPAYGRVEPGEGRGYRWAPEEWRYAG